MGDIAKDINSKFLNEKIKAVINIKYTAHWLDNIGNEILKPFNISIPQYNILRILRGSKKPLTVKTVKDRMVQKSPNSTRLMDKLCEKKLIQRIRCENDRRVVYIEISKNGLTLLSKINMKEFDNIMEALTENEAKTLNKLLDKIRS